MRKTAILFVDDEPNILSGLKRMLRQLRKEIDLHFVESGQEALDYMAANPVDIIVSDMRMPQMDGATLLKIVQERYPQVMRMILSGHADQEAILETVGVAHQFLAKPTSADQLKEVLGRACRLQEIFTNSDLKSIISKIGRLPSLPSIYQELQNKLREPECSVEDVARIIEKDMAMSAKVLQLVNSAFFGLYKNIESPARAVNLLGLDTVKGLVLSVGVFSEISGGKIAMDRLQSLWQHSFQVAVFAKHISNIENQSQEFVNNTFIAGLLHDIGQLLFFINFQPQYEEILKLASTRSIESQDAEKEVLNANHAEAGSYMVGLWGLPVSVVEAIAFHHRLDEYPSSTFSIALAVHAANVISQQLHPLPPFALPVPCHQHLDTVGLAGRYEVWEAECRKLADKDNDPD